MHLLVDGCHELEALDDFALGPNHPQTPVVVHKRCFPMGALLVVKYSHEWDGVKRWVFKVDGRDVFEFAIACLVWFPEDVFNLSYHDSGVAVGLYLWNHPGIENVILL